MLALLRAAKVAIHLALVFIAFIAAYEVRRDMPWAWWTSSHLARAVLTWGLFYTLIAAVVEGVMRTERSSWRFASTREVFRLALSAAITAAAFIVLIFLTNRAIVLPRSTLVLSAGFSLFFMVSVRMIWRVRWDPSLAFGELFGAKPAGIPLTLVGDIGHAESYLRGWRAGVAPEYQPVGIVTPDARAVGQTIHGVPVSSVVDDLVRRLTSGSAKAEGGSVLFLADPIAGLGLTTADIGRLRAEGYRLLRQASAVELKSGAAQGALREMKLEEFLPRPPLNLESGSLAALVAGRRVLVTGAGGSIGSEVARQLIRFGCAHIALLDHSEFALFEIDRELANAGGEASRSAILCNVRDETRVREVFAAERPELVFHAAALKHVTLVEINPAEGVLTNVLGTWNVAAAAREAGVAHMVMISTDKAVDPTNMMGSTKRLAEALLHAHADGETRFSVVRFGNVLGSAGSVVPIFRDQIERGGPITITDPDVERFFMTIPEAVQLVLQATALRARDSGRSGLRKFILEMGQPVKIVDLARQMIELSSAGQTIDIEFIGLRPGEKLTEALVDDGERATPCVPGITEIEAEGSDGGIGADEVAFLTKAARAGETEALWARVQALVRSVRRSSVTRLPVPAARAALARSAGEAGR